MTEYHCEFCGATGTELRNEKKGCCNNCGAPIGITKKEADKIYEHYYSGLPFMSTAAVMIDVTAFGDTKRVYLKGIE